MRMKKEQKTEMSTTEQLPAWDWGWDANKLQQHYAALEYLDLSVPDEGREWDWRVWARNNNITWVPADLEYPYRRTLVTTPAGLQAVPTCYFYWPEVAFLGTNGPLKIADNLSPELQYICRRDAAYRLQRMIFDEN